MAERVHEGGCLCGAVRYRLRGEPLRMVYCHCGMCRRSSGAPVTAWAVVAAAQLNFTRGDPARYASSGFASRGFCARCGSQLTFAYNERPEELDLTVGSLDDPGAFPPQRHYFVANRVPWLEVADDLPRFDALPEGHHATGKT